MDVNETQLQKYTAVLILNYNNYEDTINCIESVELYNTAPIKYIVVDNGSTQEKAVKELDKYFSEKFADRYLYISDNYNQIHTLPYLTFLSSKSNDGYARGNNKGLELIYMFEEIEYVLILNNDVLFVEDILPFLLTKYKVLPNCGIISPILYKKGLDELDYNCARLNATEWEIINVYMMWYRDIFGYISRSNNRRLILKRNIRRIDEEFIEIELPSGSCMLANKMLLRDIGGFDSNTFLYYEENILFKKLKKINRQNYLIPSQKCIHLGASSTSKSNSVFIQRVGLNSACYYLRNYCEMSIPQSFGLRIALFSFNIKLWLKRICSRLR